jgi:hypothetical protein
MVLLKNEAASCMLLIFNPISYMYCLPILNSQGSIQDNIKLKPSQKIIFLFLFFDMEPFRLPQLTLFRTMNLLIYAKKIAASCYILLIFRPLTGL